MLYKLCSSPTPSNSPLIFQDLNIEAAPSQLKNMSKLMVESKKKDVMSFDKNNKNMKAILKKHAK